MRNIDNDGLMLCDIQGNVFSSSLKCMECSSEIFIRRFMNSNIAKEFDSLAFLDCTLSFNDVLCIIDEEFGKSNYGKIKYKKNVLYWIGYIYRYMCYIYEISSKTAYKIIKPKELNELYYAYHSFDCLFAIDRILESKNISFKSDEQDKLLLNAIKKRRYQNNINITKDLEDTDLKFSDSTSPIEENETYSFSIFYKNENVGKLSIIKKIDNICRLFIDIDLEKDEIFSDVLLLKIVDYIKNEFSNVTLQISALKEDVKLIDSIKKLSFEYFNEDDDFVYFQKTVN